jgi:hypothetical protein
MPGKSKKGQAPADDDFDDIIAQAEQLNISITASSSSSSRSPMTDNANNVKSRSVHISRYGTEAEIIELCLHGDLAQLKQCIKRVANTQI